MFVKKHVECVGYIYSVFVVSLLFILKDSGKHFLLFFLEIISFIVFCVFLMSDLYLAKVDAKQCCLDARMLLFSIVLHVFKFIHIISYIHELGFVSFILLYK